MLFGAWGGYAAFRIQSLSQIAQPVEESWNAELTQLWAPFLETNRPLLICIGAPLFIRYPNLRVRARSRVANAWEELDSSPRFTIFKKPFPTVIRSMVSFTGVGEASGAFQLGKLLGMRRRDILLTRSNLLSWAGDFGHKPGFCRASEIQYAATEHPIKQEVRLDPDGIGFSIRTRASRHS